MAEGKTNDAIRRFKTFLRKHPEIIEHVRKNNKKWRDVFDDWVIFGESHKIWETYGVDIENSKKDKDAKHSGISMSRILEAVDKLDTQQWQKRLDTINGAITGINQLIGQFKQDNTSNGQASANSDDTDTGSEGFPAGHSGPAGYQRPFFFRRD